MLLCIVLLYKFVKLDPVDFHLDRIIFRIGLADPAALNLHVYEQIKRCAERILSLLVCFYFRVGKCSLAVDGEHKAVRQYLNGIDIEAVGINLACRTLFRVAFLV